MKRFLALAALLFLLPFEAAPPKQPLRPHSGPPGEPEDEEFD